jgi:superfamily II DNA or RNA helicase
MVESKPMGWLIEQGFLSNYRYFAPTMPDMAGVKKTMGDFSDKEAAEVMDKPKITGDAVTHWLKHARGMRTICFCVTIAHAEHTAASFQAAGITAAVVSAKTPAHERKKMFIDLADGRLQVLCNVELVTTGFDLSAQAGRDVPVECVIMLRPTQSLALYIQMVGRALRRKPYPAVILDHAGNSSRHGLPDDEREWSLDGKPAKGAKSTTNAPATCSGCFGQVRRPTPSHCPHCGEPMRAEVKPKELAHDDGELVEVTKSEKRRELLREAGKARSIEDLTELGRQRGYRYPAQWATKVFNARRSVR